MGDRIDFGPKIQSLETNNTPPLGRHEEPSQLGSRLIASSQRTGAQIRLTGFEAQTGNFTSSRRTVQLKQRESALHERKVGRSIIAAAQREADRILKEAKQSAIVETEAARKRAYEDARREILADALDTVTLRRKTLESAKEELAAIALAVAEEVVGDTLQVNPGSLLKRIDRALRFALNSKTVRLYVNPIDITVIREELTQLAATPGLQSPITLIPEGEIRPGDARIETNHSTIECSVQGHLEGIRAHLLSDETLRFL